MTFFADGSIPQEDLISNFFRTFFENSRFLDTLERVSHVATPHQSHLCDFITRDLFDRELNFNGKVYAFALSRLEITRASFHLPDILGLFKCFQQPALKDVTEITAGVVVQMSVDAGLDGQEAIVPNAFPILDVNMDPAIRENLGLASVKKDGEGSPAQSD